MKKVFCSDNKQISGEISINVSNSNYSDYLFINIETKIDFIGSTVKVQYKCSTTEEIRKIIIDAEKDFQKMLNDFAISDKAKLLSFFNTITIAKNYV